MNQNDKIFYETIRDMPVAQKKDLMTKKLYGEIINFGEVIVEDKLECGTCLLLDVTKSMQQKKIVCKLQPGEAKIKNGKCNRKIITYKDNFAFVSVISIVAALLFFALIVIKIIVTLAV